MVMLDVADRLSRQINIIHPDMQASVALVVGTGMLGGWTAHALSRCMAKVHIWDGDVVEEVNAGNQPYNGMQVGLPKVTALADSLAGLPVEPTHALFDGTAVSKDRLLNDPSLPPTGIPRHLVVVSGVDSFVPRRQIAEWAKAQGATLFVDTRALGNTAVVLIVPHDQIDRYLSEEMMEDADTPDLPCGFNGTAGVGMYVASQVYSYLNSYFRGLPVPFAQVTDLYMMEFLRRDMLTGTAANKEATAETE